MEGLSCHCSFCLFSWNQAVLKNFYNWNWFIVLSSLFFYCHLERLAYLIKIIIYFILTTYINADGEHLLTVMFQIQQCLGISAQFGTDSIRVTNNCNSLLSQIPPRERQTMRATGTGYIASWPIQLGRTDPNPPEANRPGALTSPRTAPYIKWRPVARPVPVRRRITVPDSRPKCNRSGASVPFCILSLLRSEFLSLFVTVTGYLTDMWPVWISVSASVSTPWFQLFNRQRSPTFGFEPNPSVPAFSPEPSEPVGRRPWRTTRSNPRFLARITTPGSTGCTNYWRTLEKERNGWER